jgi:two-component system nitrogen regulation response regulator GlnG
MQEETSQNPKILIAEDEDSLRMILKKMFAKKGYTAETVPDGEMAIHKIRNEPFDIALIDINMPRASGFEVLSVAKKEKPELTVIMITAQDTMKNAVEAMKQGAFDYITKPFELDALELVVERALETQQLAQEVQRLRQEVKSRPFDPQAKIIGQSKVIHEIYKLIGKVSASDVPVLISGESGTGKELIAKSIHFSSARAPHPFIAVNCAAIPKDLLESELFGYRKGAFTGADESRPGYFEAAQKGTLFLDEIGDMPYPLQSKLLRTLQEKEIYRLGTTEAKPIDVRIISASNQDLSHLVSQKKFREDLFFRLNVVPIRVPPLRERREDIEILLNYFSQKFQNEFSLPPKNFANDAIELLKNYSWPGNVRELENVIKRLMVLTSGPLIKEKDVQNILNENPAILQRGEIEEIALEEIVRNKLAKFLEKFDRLEPMDLYEMIIQMVERPLLSLVLQKTGGNQIQAARVLGINRNTLRKKIRTLKINKGQLLEEPE